MILLADTNIVIDFLKAVRKDDKKSLLVNLFAKHEVVLCGVVRAELLHGAYSEKNKSDLLKFVSCYTSANLEENDWNVFGTQLYAYRTNGVTVPFADAVIASVGIKYGIPVWTNDEHFRMMTTVIPELKVYRTEELI